MEASQVKNFEIENGLGKICFSPELISSIIKKVLVSFPKYQYISYSIRPIKNNYYEASVKIKSLDDALNHKQIDRLQKELLIVMKQSLSLTCVVALNICDGK